MKITYLGHSCFLIKDNVSFLFDPYKGIGYEMDEVYADVTFCSHAHFDHHALERVQTLKVIDKPFEGRSFTLSVTSITCDHDEAGGSKRGKNEVYKVVCNGKTLVHLGDIGTVDERVVDFAKGCDILFLPVGGYYTVDCKQAKELAQKIAPKHVIPMHYKTGTSTLPISTVEEFASLYDSVTTVKNPCEAQNLANGVNIFEF